ncbi:MAG: hypothetical protein CME64_15810 [Halobacteriovoraceae bacterium]|nr:hypothetical protein [Halobacteriovoraceae bacterium]
MFRENIANIYGADLQSVERINKLERMSQRFRAHTNDNEILAPTWAKNALAKFEQAEERFLSGKLYDALGTYKALFNTVETSVLTIDNYSVLAKALRLAHKSEIKNPAKFLEDFRVSPYLVAESAARIGKSSNVESELRRVEKILKRHYRNLGVYFDEYNLVRTRLRKLQTKEHCDKVCQETIKKFYERVGLSSDTLRVLLERFAPGRQSLSIDYVRNVFNSHPEAILVARKREFITEGIGLVKMYVNKFRILSRLFRAASKMSWAQKKMVVKLFQSVFNKEYKEIHHTIVNRVTHNSNKSAPAKMEKVKEELQEVDPERFWVNFARLREGKYQDTLAALERHAQKNEPHIYEQIQSAKEIAEKLGPIGGEDARGAYKFLGLMAFGGATWAYFNFSPKKDTGPEDLDLPDPSEVQEDDDETEVLVEYMGAVDNESQEVLEALITADEIANSESN